MANKNTNIPDPNPSVFSDGNNEAPGQVNRKNAPDDDEKEELYEYMADELGFVTGLLDYDKMDEFAPTGKWEWEMKQLDHIEHGGWWCANKCRQYGISTDFAVKAFARGTLTPNNYTAIFVSYKKDEAQNKVNYVRQFLEALPPSFEKDIVRDPLQLIEWENPNGTRAKIISHAQRPIRGLNGDVFLDELAFYQFDDDIYSSALPAVSGARAALEITSTPFGADGKFWEIHTSPDEYPEFKREMIYWWQCLRKLKEPDEVSLNLPKDASKIDVMVHAEEHALDMTLEERVNTYGNHWLQMQYNNADTDADFRQEFEGFFVDSQAAYFTKDLVKSCMYQEHGAIDDYEPEQRDFDCDIDDAIVDVKDPVQQAYPNVDFRLYDDVRMLKEQVVNGQVKRNLIAGIDVGSASGHGSAIVILEEKHLEDGSTLQIERYREDINKMTLPEQQRYFKEMFSDGIIRKIIMDTTAIGHQMGVKFESMFNERFEAKNLGGSTKKIRNIMTNLHNRMEGGGIALEFDRTTISQLYAIKKKRTANRNVKFQADDKKSSHSERAYAIALASFGGTKWGEDIASFSKSKQVNLSELRNPTIEKSSGNPKRSVIVQSMKDMSSELDFREQKAFMEQADPGQFIEDYDE